MGEHDVLTAEDPRLAQAFVKSLLADVMALEQMIRAGQIESNVRRAGAEQEMFLVDRDLMPAPVALDILHAAADPRLTTELAKFNLEANLSPRLLRGAGLHDMENELSELVDIVRRTAGRFNADVLLTGILPTLRQSDLTLDNLTPIPRYYELDRTLKRLRGSAYNIHIKGLDEFYATHDNLMFEACCSSFQIHLQVGPAEFAGLYNLAQAISAPLLALSANSPVLMGHRLWHETRVALFQHSNDERSSVRQARSQPPRASFGDAWINDSVIEIFRDEIARYRVILAKKVDEDPLALLAKGQLPELTALRLHNGTVWRWNRPCYGVSDGIAHLRIEHRPMPSGPTIIDEMANAAFFYGLMTALPGEYGPVEKKLRFDDAKSNFFAAARYGLKAHIAWLGGRDIPVATLIREELIPAATEGLRQAGIDPEDITRYIDVVRERIERDQTGALWSFRSLEQMAGKGTRELRQRQLTEAMLEQQTSGLPVAQWKLAEFRPVEKWGSSFRTVSDLMSTDVFTVRPDDLVDLAASVMNWRHIRHVPVEDDDGRLVGLISHRDLLQLLARGLLTLNQRSVTVKELMKQDVVTVPPETPTLEALATMRRCRVGCLPVTRDGRLVGIVTAYDFLGLAAEIVENA
jgi:CBS domain-containing protein